MKKTSQRKIPIDKEAIMKKHDFAYIREHFYDTDYTFEDIRGDIYQIYNDTLDLTQLSAEGKNTVRVTNFFVNETQSKATSVRAKMSPHRAIQDDDALCEIFNRIDSHPRFFNIRKDEEEKLLAQGFTPEILEQDISGLTPIQQEAIEHLRKQYKDALNKADLKEVRRAVAHMPAFHRVSQFPNHVAQRIYERYAPFKGAVILDSSCVDRKTQFWDGKQWKFISDYQEGDKVLQYNEDGTTTLVTPIKYHHYINNEPFYLEDNKYLNSCLTGNHRVCYRNRINETSQLTKDIKWTTMQDIVDSITPTNMKFRGRIPRAFTYYGNVHIQEDELRLLIALQADGILGWKSTGYMSLRASKERKLKRIEELLTKLNIPFTHTIDKSGYGFDKQGNPYKPRETYTFKWSRYYDFMDETKTFPFEWRDLDKESKDIFLEELPLWDGSLGCINHYTGHQNFKYYSNNKANVELVDWLITSSGYFTSTGITEDLRLYETHNSINYGVSTQAHLYAAYGHNLSEYYDPDKYCFTVPSGMLVLRRNNQQFITGNCGWGNRMMAALSSKYGYKYLGTDPNSEMHPNYRALADTIYETVYKDKVPGEGRKYPEDYFDIRDQGSEFDIPEWHGMSGYEILEREGEGVILKNKFTGQEFNETTNNLQVPHFTKVMKEEPKLPGEDIITHQWEHPLQNGKGINDTGKYRTTGLKLPAIYQTHSDEIFYSGIGDVSFTSPPYFFLECYTEDSQKGDLSTGQSAGKGANYMDWLRDFVYPTVVNHFNYLKPGAYYIYNLKDLPKEGFYIYSDWLSICLDVGFELIEQPEMILKSRRQFGRNEDGSDKINFKGATELVGVLRKPLKPTDPVLTSNHKDSLYHVINNFSYPLIAACRPKGFESKLPKQIEDYLINKFKDTPRYKYGKRK